MNKTKSNIRRLYSESLDDGSEEIIKEIVEQLQQYKSDISIQNELTGIDVSEFLEAIELDYPEIFDFELEQTGYRENRLKTLHFQRENPQDLALNWEKITQKLSQLSEQIAKLSPYQETFHFYAFLGDFQQATDSRQEYNSILCFLHKRATSLGLSKAFQFLCNYFSIECRTIRCVASDKYQHYFNQVKLNGGYYNIDCGLVQETKKQFITHAYFCFPNKCIQQNFKCQQLANSDSWKMNVYYQNGEVISAATTYKDVATVINKQKEPFADFLVVNETPLTKIKQLLQNGLLYSKCLNCNQYQFDQIEVVKFVNVPVFRLFLVNSKTKCSYFSEAAETGTPLQEQIVAFIENELPNTKQFFFQLSDNYLEEKNDFIENFSSIVKILHDQYKIDDSVNEFEYCTNDDIHLVMIEF